MHRTGVFRDRERPPILIAGGGDVAEPAPGENVAAVLDLHRRSAAGETHAIAGLKFLPTLLLHHQMLGIVTP